VGDVTVIGCVQADVVVSPVSDLPRPGGTQLTGQMSIRVGGAGANAALAFVETGMRARLMGCVGDDQLGRWMCEELEPHGLADELVVVAGERSGLTVALESPQRDRTFLTYLGVNDRWDPSMIPDDALTCDNLLLCDYFVAPGMQGEAARGLLERSAGSGARTFFDTSWDPDGFGESTRREVRELLGSVDVFLPNEAEACALTGLDVGRGLEADDRIPDGDRTLEAARVLQAASGGWIAVKLGPRGCLAVGPDGAELRIPAPAVAVADTTGAGDAFNAGLVHALSDGAGWPDALAAATGFASAIISRPSRERHALGAVGGAGRE
jgi:sugar/nucleoside kinase (ribokinase family)